MDEKEILENLLEKCYRYLSYRPRSEREMTNYMLKKSARNKNIDEKIIAAAIERLKEQDLVNDDSFVAWWVDSRSAFRPKGPFALRGELLAKGISKDTIDRYFEDNKMDEADLAKKVLLKKERQLSSLEREEKFKKSMSLLLRRGFSYHVSKKAFEDFIKKE